MQDLYAYEIHGADMIKKLWGHEWTQEIGEMTQYCTDTRRRPIQSPCMR